MGKSTSPINVFADRLAGMQDQVVEAMNDYTPGGVKVPDATYIGRESAEIRESQSSGKLMVARQFTIAEGEHTGLRVWDNIVFEDNDIGWQILRRWVEMHGYEWPETNLAQVGEIVLAINEAGALVKFRLKTTKSKTDEQEYQNVSVLEIMSEDNPDSQAQAEAAPESEAAPEPEADAPADAPADGDEYDAMDRNALKKFILATPELVGVVRVTVKMSDDDIRAAIRENFTPEEQPAQEGSGVDVGALLAFAASQSVDGVVDTMSADEIVEVMSGYGFEENELTAEEIEMLTSVGLEANIQKSTPPPPPAKPVAARPVAAKTVAPAPKAATPAPKAVAPKAVAPTAKPVAARPVAAKTPVLPAKKPLIRK